jgi:hypothetical protein
MPVTSTAARPRGSRPARSLFAALAGFALLLLALAGSAFADSATISVTDTNGHSDPVSGVPRTYTVSGTTSSPKNVYVKYRNPGPTPCAPTAGTDSGDFWDDYGTYDDDTSSGDRGNDANGAFSFSDVFSTGLEGTYLFCIWVADSPTQSVTAIAQTITFRSPSGTISATINPSTPQPGQQASATINGVSEAPESVFSNVRPAGTPCAQTYDADYKATYPDSFSEDSDGTSVNGNFDVSTDVTQQNAGNYVLCLWLADSSTDTSPVAGPQPIPFTVGTPFVPHKVTKECKTARHRRYVWAKKVKKTKRQLLHARRRATRHRLTRRLKKQRHSLKVATRKAKVICAT